MPIQPPGRITSEPIVYDQVVKACTTCGVLVSNNYAERHAQRHIDAGEPFRLPSLEEAERTGQVVKAREIAEEAAKRERARIDAESAAWRQQAEAEALAERRSISPVIAGPPPATRK